MTSVAVILSAATSIKCLMDLHNNSGSWLKEADEILKTLEEMKKAVYDRREEAGMEQKIKKMVQLSYESVDAIADSVKPSSSSSMIFDQLTRSGGTKLQKLHDRLKGSLNDFQGEKTMAGGGREKSHDASPPSKKADNPKANVRAIERKNSISSGPSSTGSEVNKAAGSEPNPESITETTKADLFDQLKSKLLEPLHAEDSREVYIVGESGMGKSTLARKLYNDPDVRKFFQVFCWVPINHNFRIKAVLHILLQQLGPWPEEHIKEMNEIELISQIFDVVKDKSYLLVLDGIGALQDWESIRLALPLVNSTRVMITTSSNEFSSDQDHHYRIPGLTQSETLALLNKEASFDSEVGEAIYHASCGLPLYATILAKSLKSDANNKHLVKELHAYKSKEGTSHVLGACYKRLAPKLKPCFLYLGQFPPCQDIQVDKLYLQLAAENLIIPPDDSNNISPQTLRDYLKTLADLKVVRVEEDPLSETGLYKTCRLHDQVREFCKSQGLDEEFFQIIDFESTKQVVGVGPYTRRLAIYMTKYRGDRDTALGFKGNESVKKISSLLIFDSGDKERSGWPSELNALEDFSRLRVLSFDGVDFRARKLPKGLEKLLLLRYLSFRGCFLEALPSSLCKLTQLETLDLLVRDECEVIIHETIFNNMKRMVHLYLPRKYKGSGKGKVKLQDLEFMETLINFDTEVFDVEDLKQLKKLKILSTVSNGEESKGMDAVINLLNKRKEELQHSSMEIRGFDFYNQDCVSAWEKLLKCRFVDSVQIEGEIGELPEEDDGDGGGGGRLTEMVLHGSELEADPMGYFGRFQNLRNLVLADNAFMGTDILISSSSSAPMFPKLRSLKFRNLQYLEKLTIGEGAVPELSSLQIENCGDALELTIPKELDQRLKNVIGGDAYSVVPSPSKFITTP